MTINPLLPNTHPRTEITIRVPYWVEQHEEEQVKGELSDPNVRWYHDPFWRERLFSIQHIRDCQEGKQFSWLWTPMTEVFNLAQVMFVILPFAAYLNRHGQTDVGVRGLIFLSLSLQLGLSGAKKALAWYHDWKFRHTPYRIIRH